MGGSIWLLGMCAIYADAVRLAVLPFDLLKVATERRTDTLAFLDRTALPLLSKATSVS